MDKKFEKYVYSVIKKYQKILLLDKHTFTLHFGLENEKAIMECVFNYPYLNVQLNYGKNVIKDWKDGINIIPYIVHEMCHPITDPIYSKCEDRFISKGELLDERERLTDFICQIVIKNKL